MSLQTICLFEQEAKRLIYLQDAQESCLLRIEEKQQLVSIYTKLVEAFDSVDPGVKYYFMQKLQQLVVRVTFPTSVLSQGSIMSKLKKTQASFLTRSFMNSNKSEVSSKKKTFIRSGQIDDDIQNTNVIQNQFKILQEQQQHKQQTIKSSLSNQQQSIVQRLKKRKQKTRRKSFQKLSEKNNNPPLNKDDLKRMQKDLTKRMKRVTARLSKIQTLKAFSQKLAQNPIELEKLRKQIFEDKIEEEDQDSEAEN